MATGHARPKITSDASKCTFDCLEGSGNTDRQILTLASLRSKETRLVDYRHFTIPENAANPRNTFEGSLTLHIKPGRLTEVGTHTASAYPNSNSLPPFEFSFVQNGTHIVPAKRQLVNTGHTVWEWLLLPGRIWQENGDNGYSRVALPFALQEINANCTHNGVMTFLFKDDGKITNVAYQIAQETCAYFKFNLHGKVAAEYSPFTLANRDEIVSSFAQEVANRLPVKSLTALAEDYPDAGISVSEIGSDQTKAHLTGYGVFYQGTHYRGSCVTRYGEYPFCEVMALPSYSVAKTVVTGMALMHAEKRYPGLQKDILVSKLVAECDGPQWQDVNMLNVLDMATGNYDLSGHTEDEHADRTIDGFFMVTTHAEKIRHSCAYPRKSKPGTRFVYHTSDTYILSRMLQRYHELHAGSRADYFQDLLVTDIYQPLHLSPLSFRSKRTLDNVRQVFGGYGLTLTGDDFVKLGRFLMIQKGMLNGHTLLDPTLLAEALQQTESRGLSAGTASRYQHSVWAYDLKHAMPESCSSSTWLPYMSGYGGIGVVMLPTGIIYYYVSDNNEYGFMKSVAELNKISPLCGE